MITFLVFSHILFVSIYTPQSISLIRNLNYPIFPHGGSQTHDNNNITISILTWNLAQKSPSPYNSQFLSRFHTDIIVIGTQETEKVKPRRKEGRQSISLRRLFIQYYRNYIPLALHSLGGIQLLLLCKNKIMKEVLHVKVVDVVCGRGKIFPNKGAIGVFVEMSNRNIERKDKTDTIKLLFINCHLDAHVENIHERNTNYWNIMKELQSQVPFHFVNYHNHPNLMLSSLNHIFFSGDLNYRINLSRVKCQEIIKQLSKLFVIQSIGIDCRGELDNYLWKLLQHDQLRICISQNQSFTNFQEGRITFLPTYKFDKDRLDYDTSKKLRIPAWTDRILYRSYGNKVSVVEYDCILHAKHSDHRPVYAIMSVDMKNEMTNHRTNKITNP